MVNCRMIEKELDIGQIQASLNVRETVLLVSFDAARRDWRCHEVRFRMSQRLPLNQSAGRTTRRHDRHGGYDLADIYEARLLAQGVTANEFITRRSSADLPVLPLVKPLLIGRGSPGWGIKPPTPDPIEETEAAPAPEDEEPADE
jgi:hypothetical protein